MGPVSGFKHGVIFLGSHFLKIFGGGLSIQAFTPSLAMVQRHLPKATYGRDVQFFQEDWEVPWEPKKIGSFVGEKLEKKTHQPQAKST